MDVGCVYRSDATCATSFLRAVLPAARLGLSASTAWPAFYSSESYARKSPPSESRKRKKIGARSDIVEVDECYTSCGKGGRGLAGKIAFAGAIERRGWRVRIEHIKSASRESLTSFIARNVRRGSIVHTDSFKSYLYVPKYGYKHCRVNHFWRSKTAKSEFVQI